MLARPSQNGQRKRGPVKVGIAANRSRLRSIAISELYRAASRLLPIGAIAVVPVFTLGFVVAVAAL